MCDGSWAAFYLFGKEREQEFKKKKGDPTGSDRPPGLGTSELEAQAELHAASRMCTAGMQEARTADTAWVTCRARRSDAVHAAVNAVVLRMVEQVEILPAKIERA